MKKILLLFFFPIIVFLFYLKIDSFAGHSCNQRCNNAADIVCNEQMPTPTYSQGSCNAGLVCYSGAGSRCRNPYCPNDTDCNCSIFAIQGLKQPNDSPFADQTITLDGANPQTANPYFITGVPANSIHQVNASAPSGSDVGYTLCYDSTDCHQVTPTPGNQVYICSNKSPNTNLSYADLWWHYTPKTPNCKDIISPDTVLAGDSIDISATYENGGGGSYPVTQVGMVVYGNPVGCDSILFDQSQPGAAGTYTFSWTPTAIGTYTAFCRAWNNGDSDNPECRGDCVDGPPRYMCSGPTAEKNITVIDPQPWYKLKNASLNKVGDHNINAVQNINKFTNTDPDDNTDRSVIIGNPGVLISSGNYNPGPPYSPIPASANNWYAANYSNFNLVYFDSFFQYLSSRKLIKEISSLLEIDSNGVYFIKTDSLTINAQPPNKNFVLVVRNNENNGYSDVIIKVNKFNLSSDLSLLNSIAVLAKNINITNEVQNIGGIFITTDAFSYSNSDGLKIKGNLISKNAIVLQNRPDNSQPSLFVVFAPKAYLFLLPYLSIAKYDWQQTQ